MEPESFLKRRALALCNEAQALQVRGELTRAIDLYTRSLGVHPTAEAHTFRGWAYSMLGRDEDAIDECKKAIATDPSFGNPYNDIGAYLLQKQLLDEAIPWLERAKHAARYAPRHFPCMNLGRIYAAKGMVREAIREFEEALHFQPRDPVCIASLEELKETLLSQLPLPI